ncbi:aminopeptidase P family protein [Helicobacter sp. 23-1045]
MIKSRLKSLRKLMTSQNLNAFIIPSNDIHNNEYLPPCFKDREFMSGFSGSAGTLIILPKKAYLCTDGRYFIQAQRELEGSGIALHKSPNYAEFLRGVLKKGDCVGVNAKTLSISAHKELKTALKGVDIRFCDLVSEIWERPPLPCNAIYPQGREFIGAESSEKLAQIRAKMAEFGADCHFISALDDIAWITNLRGSDIEYNPVFMSFLLISKAEAVLFAQNLAPKLSQNLKKQGFKICEYNRVETALCKIKNAKVLLDARKTSIYIAKVLKAGQNKIIKRTNPSATLKAMKNEAELAHIKNAMISDGVALCEFFAWLESRIKKGQDFADSKIRPSLAEDNSHSLPLPCGGGLRGWVKSQKNSSAKFGNNDFTHPLAPSAREGGQIDSNSARNGANKTNSTNLTELDIDTQITAFRAKNPLFVGNSFATIAGFNANGALPHYRATQDNHSEIFGDGLLLIDSGAQYQNGTSDITRVVGVGRVSEAQKRDYTLVLKSLIALSTAVFTPKIALPLLDCLARAPLWREGIEYMHGTGHGVGYFLNVHEAPVAISHFATPNAENIAQVGMITSIEPGIYREGKWGIRLENLVAIVSDKSTEFGEFLRFETLTLCPFEKDLINFKMLNSAESAWLKDYNAKVFTALSPHLKGHALKWLKRQVE